MEPAQIKALRARLGWSQSALARALGVDSRTVVRWECGESRPFPRHLQILAELEESIGDGEQGPSQASA